MNKTKKIKWEETGMGNYVMARRGWGVSYNPSVSESATRSPF